MLFGCVKSRLLLWLWLGRHLQSTITFTPAILKISHKRKWHQKDIVISMRQSRSSSSYNRHLPGCVVAQIKYSKRCHKINNIRNQINILAKSKKKRRKRNEQRAKQTRTSDCVYKIDCGVCVCVCVCAYPNEKSLGGALSKICMRYHKVKQRGRLPFSLPLCLSLSLCSL